jgi:peptide/nickel transport system permease protein
MTASDSPPAAEFDRIEWASVRSRSAVTRRDLTFAGSLVALVAFAGFYHFVHPPDAPLPILGFWEPLLVDWMFYVALLVFGFYAVWPLLEPGSVLRANWSDILENRLALASLGWLSAFLVVGTIEPVVVTSLPFGPLNQPPVGFSLYEGFVGNCVGELVGDQCHGTLAHPFGTTGNGQDVLLLTVAGARTALQMTLITAAIIVPLGVGVGTFAGYVGGWVDEALMRYVDAQQTIPALFIYIALAVLYGPSLSLMVVVFGLLNWGDVARLVRSEVLQVREAEFITAARGAGLARWPVIRHHVIPNVTPAVLSITTLKLPLLVIIEATLSYLQFGDPRVVSWGNVVSVNVLTNQDPSLYWWIGVFPIGALVLTTLALSLFGNTLQDALDPRRTGGGLE